MEPLDHFEDSTTFVRHWQCFLRHERKSVIIRQNLRLKICYSKFLLSIFCCSPLNFLFVFFCICKTKFLSFLFFPHMLESGSGASASRSTRRLRAFCSLCFSLTPMLKASHSLHSSLASLWLASLLTPLQ